MQLKVKKSNKDGVVRLETSGDVKEIWVNEDFMHPNQESISIGFLGESSSGIIDFTPAEIEKLYNSVKNRMHLIKGFKRLNAGGVKLL
jgi:hypothetical protein